MPVGFAVQRNPVVRIHLADFNPDMTGATTSDTAIANALAQLPSTGGEILVPSGMLVHNADILVSTSNVTLRGNGRSSIVKNGSSNAINGIKISGANHVLIKDLTIDGNKVGIVSPPAVGSQYVALNAIYITGCDDVTVENCYIHDHYEGGILADSSTNLIITKNRIANGNDNGIFLRPSPGNVSCSQATISKNIVNGMGFSGIQAVRSTYLTFTGNVSFSNGPTAGQGDGIGIEGCTYVTISGNECHSNGINGIHVRYTAEGGANLKSSRVVVSSNVCYNHLSTNGDAGGISVDDADDVLVAGNLCSGNYWGINLNNGQAMGVTNCALRGNQCKSNTNVGIHLVPTVSSHLTLSGNYIADNGSDGIYASQRILVTDGVSKGNTGEGVHLASGASNSLIQGVAIYDNTDNGILIDSGVTGTEVRNCYFNNIVGTNQGRALYESNNSGGATLMVNNRIVGFSNEPYHFSNTASRIFDEEREGQATITANYTITSIDQVILCNQAGAITVTLTTAVKVDGRVMIIKDKSGNASTNTITVATTGGQTIDGAASKVINTNYGIVRVISDGANWFTL